MWSWALSVHVGGSGGSAFESYFHILFHFIDGIDLYFEEILDKNSLIGTFLQFHSGLGVLTEKVVNLFVVNFNETATDKMSFGRIVVCNCYNLLECSRNDTSRFLSVVIAHHRMSLTASSLSVCKDGAVVAFQNVVNEWEGALLVDETLSTVGCENIIERKSFGLIFSILFDEIDLVIFAINLDDGQASSIFLVIIHGTASHHNLNALWHLIVIIRKGNKIKLIYRTYQ